MCRLVYMYRLTGHFDPWSFRSKTGRFVPKKKKKKLFSSFSVYFCCGTKHLSNGTNRLVWNGATLTWNETTVNPFIYWARLWKSSTYNTTFYTEMKSICILPNKRVGCWLSQFLYWGHNPRTNLDKQLCRILQCVS